MVDKKNDSCHPDDNGQDYIDCPNCACGRIYALECDCCGWSEGEPLRDYSYRKRLLKENPNDL